MGERLKPAPETAPELLQGAVSPFQAKRDLVADYHAGKLTKEEFAERIERFRHQADKHDPLHGFASLDDFDTHDI